MSARILRRLTGHRITEWWSRPRTVWLCDCGAIWESR